MTASPSVTLAYFSDILCVWAYVAQARLVEIARQFGEEVLIDCQFCSVFGNSAARIARAWADKGAYEGFNRHLRDVGAQFGHVEVHPDVWLTTRPASSDNVHLFIKAVQIAEREGSAGVRESMLASVSGRLTWALRLAFFRDCRDIAARSVQRELAVELGVRIDAVEAIIDSGAASAALAGDYQNQERYGVEGSPTFVLNEGRQKLYGNVGYRVIEANIRELLRAPEAGEISWC